MSKMGKFGSAIIEHVVASNKERLLSKLVNKMEEPPSEVKREAREIARELLIFAGYQVTSGFSDIGRALVGGMAVYSFQYCMFLKEQQEQLELTFNGLDKKIDGLNKDASVARMETSEQVAAIDDNVKILLNAVIKK